ncbi:MAG: hypothetical protein K0R75_2386 [Paenibacillaceae bacterium]|jgi:hypothetical protein|nr:hypothetical protein [Paenibacillaceae bacterium]
MHPRYSLDGTKVAFNIENKRAFLFTMDADGSNLQLFGVKPLHWYWYEGNTFVGQDTGVGRDGKPGDSTGRRWEASGRWIEDVSGRGNHMAVSPDGLLFASDSDYHSDPVVLKCNRKGDLSGTTIFSSPYSSAVWANGKAHVNPSFARDNSRIYYAKPTGPNKVEAYYVELTREGREGCREAEA